MAVYLNNGVSVVINTVDLSAYVTAVTVTREFDEVETTAMGDAGHKRIGGLSNDSFTISFQQDFAATKVNATLEAVLDTSSKTTTCVVKPTAAAVGATNPSYTGTIFVGSWTPINGGVGDLATVDSVFKVNGAIAKAIV